MSSVCSANSCTSPDVASSNVSSNKMNESRNNETSAARLRTTVPDVKKDNKYWERRRRNNEAARRSREKRRMNDMNMDNRIMELAQRNKQLEQELYQFKVCGGTGTIPNSGSQLNEGSAKRSKLTPIIPASDNNGKDKIQTTQLNGMVFPIFTTIKPVITSCDMLDTNDSNTASACKMNVISDANRFQTNLLTFSSIPLLSNIIATTTTNYGEDIISKPTLLLPPFQIPPKTVVDPPVSSLLSPSNTSEGHETATKPSVETSGDFQLPYIKTELHDVLDLRIKHENGTCFFDEPGALPPGFHVPVMDNCVDSGSISNSFLSGSVAPGPGKCHSPPLARPLTPSPTEANDINHRYNSYNTRRRHKLPGELNMNHYRRHRKDSLDHVLSLRSRLQIREEVTSAVCQENSKLHDAIHNLTDEIKQLKSVLLSLVSSSSSSPSTIIANDSRLNPIIDRLRGLPQDKTTRP